MIQENFKSTEEDEVHANASLQLQRQITATRARMSQTLDDLGEELQPRRLIEQYVNEYSEQLVDTLSTKAKRYAAEATRQTRQNPLPLLALIVGVALFVTQTSREPNDTNRKIPTK